MHSPLRYSLPAERARGKTLGEPFLSQAQMEAQGWTFGNPAQVAFRPGGGMILNGNAGSNVIVPLQRELALDKFTVHMVFEPHFNIGDGADRYLIDTVGPRYDLRKRTDGALVNTIDGLTRPSVAQAAYEAHWRHAERNVLSVSCDSAGGAGANVIRLNGVEVGSTSLAWTPVVPTAMIVGARFSLGVSSTPGVFSHLYIGAHTSALDEHLAHLNNTMFSWQNRANCVLQMRSTDYDIANVRTLDSSGNGMHFQLGDGANPATYPTQGVGLMSFNGAQYLQRAAVPRPAGPFSVAVTARNANAGVTEVLAIQRVGATTDYSFAVQRQNNNRYLWSVHPTAAAYIFSSVYTHGQPRTVIGTWDGTVGNLYVNGIRDVDSTTGVLVQPSGAPTEIRLGRSTSGVHGLNGDYHDFQYFDGIALTPTQVQDYHIKQMARLGRE